MKSIKKDLDFYKMLMSLAIPIVLQNLLVASLNLLDSIMVGNLGEKAIASVGIANQYYMLFYNTAHGFIMGAGIFVAQYWGKKDIKNIYKFMGLSLIFAMAVTLLFLGGAIFFPENIIEIFTKDSEVIELGKSYLLIVAPSYILTIITLNYEMALRGTGNTKIPMYASLIGLIFNGVLNYIFIFGKFGMVKLGVFGAGLGTLIARCFELGFILYKIYIADKNIVAGKLKEMFDIEKSMITTFLKTALPVVFNDMMWIGGLTVYFLAFSKLGTTATATMQISNTVNNVFNIFGIGIALAGGVIVGNRIGAQEEERAKTEAKKISTFSVMLGIIIGIIFFIISPYVVKLFSIEDETKKSIVAVLRIMSIVLPVRFFGIMQIIGILRGGGDVVFAILTEVVAVWAVGVPMSFLGVLYFDFPIEYVYAMSCLEEPFKALATLPRLFSGKWIKNLVKE